jgi:hypothetical protein
VKLQWTIWVLNAALQWVLLAVVLWNNRWKKHIAFAVYVSFCAAKTTTLIFVMLYWSHLYVSFNWGIRVLTLPLLIAVFREVFAAVFRPYSTLPPGTLRWFRTSVAILVVISACAAIFFPGSHPGDFLNTIFLLNRTVTLIFCGAFAFTALVSSYFGIPWQTRVYGIGVGFMLFGSVDIFISSLLAGYGLSWDQPIRAISMLSFTLALITWLTYFSLPDVQSKKPTLEQMRRLQKALDYTGAKVDSFHGMQ